MKTSYMDKKTNTFYKLVCQAIQPEVDEIAHISHTVNAKNGNEWLGIFTEKSAVKGQGVELTTCRQYMAGIVAHQMEENGKSTIGVTVFSEVFIRDGTLARQWREFLAWLIWVIRADVQVKTNEAYSKAD